MSQLNIVIEPCGSTVKARDGERGGPCSSALLMSSFSRLVLFDTDCQPCCLITTSLWHGLKLLRRKVLRRSSGEGGKMFKALGELHKPDNLFARTPYKLHP